MDLQHPLVEHGSANVLSLRQGVLLQPSSFWTIDQQNRANLAGDRPGNAIFFYNDQPKIANRNVLLEAKSGYVNVLRYKSRPLGEEVAELIENDIRPKFPGCDVMRVQLAELPPGAIISPHRDLGILTLVHRLHAPIVTHKAVKFIISGQSFFLEEGKLYDLNNVVVHSVENASDVMRIHLLVDMLPHSVAKARYHDTEESMLAAVQAKSA